MLELLNKVKLIGIKKKKVKMNIDFLKNFGIDLQDPNVSLLVLFSVCIFLLTLTSLASFLNFLVYVIIIRTSETEFVLNYIKNKPRLTKYVNFYKNVSTVFVVYDVLFFLFVNFSILSYCFRIMNKYYHFF